MKRLKQSAIFHHLLELGRKQGRIKLTEISDEWKLPSPDLSDLIKMLFNERIGIEIIRIDNEYWLDFKNYQNNFLSLNSADWISLYEILSQKEHSSDLVDKDKSISSHLQNALNLLEHVDNHVLNPLQQKFITSTQEENSFFQIEVSSQMGNQNQVFSLIPRTITHLEGTLTLIGEEHPEGTLRAIPVFQIRSFEKKIITTKALVSTFELEQFISALRSMNESEIRLILKIQKPQLKNLIPEHHFLRRPCLVTNPKGDLIWAAYVEPCASLYEWIFSLGKNAEILDPWKFKEDYLRYCEEKLKKIA